MVLGAVLASALLRMLQGYDVTQLRKRVPECPHRSTPACQCSNAVLFASLLETSSANVDPEAIEQPRQPDLFDQSSSLGPHPFDPAPALLINTRRDPAALT